MLQGRVRLVDVAAAAGVSKSVASRALADAPDIARTTRDRVHHVAQALGYHPSLRARLLGRRHGTGGARVIATWRCSYPSWRTRA